MSLRKAQSVPHFAPLPPLPHVRMQVFLVLVAIATGAGVTETGLVSMDGPNPWTSNGVNAPQPQSQTRSPFSSFTAITYSLPTITEGAVVHVAAHRGHPQSYEGCPRPQICVPQQEMGDAANTYVRGAKESRAHEANMDSACGVLSDGRTQRRRG